MTPKVLCLISQTFHAFLHVSGLKNSRVVKLDKYLGPQYCTTVNVLPVIQISIVVSALGTF